MDDVSVFGFVFLSNLNAYMKYEHISRVKFDDFRKIIFDFGSIFTDNDLCIVTKSTISENVFYDIENCMIQSSHSMYVISLYGGDLYSTIEPTPSKIEKSKNVIV